MIRIDLLGDGLFYALGRGVMTSIIPNFPIFETSINPLLIELSQSGGEHFAIPVGPSVSERETKFISLAGTLIDTNTAVDVEIETTIESQFSDIARLSSDPLGLGYIGLSPDSILVSDIARFSIVPSSPRVSLILKPDLDFMNTICVHGTMGYIQNAVVRGDTGLLWGANITTKLIPSGVVYSPLEELNSVNPTAIFSTIAVTFQTSKKYETLPWDTFLLPLIRQIEWSSSARRVDHSGIDNNLEFFNCHSIDIFPTIVYTFYDSSVINAYRMDITLFPSDYVTVIADRCMVYMRSSGTEGTGMIGPNILQVTASYFDSENQVIGFCDPAI
jgi:hypothetical protein